MRPAGGGADFAPPPLPNSRTSGLSEAGREAIEVLNEDFLNEILEKKSLEGCKSHQGQVTDQYLTFRLFIYEDGTSNRCEPKLCQNASQTT